MTGLRSGAGPVTAPRSEPDTAAATGPLSVLVVVPPWFPVPPVGYGGVEAVVDSLVRALVSRGHRVEVVGGGGSTLPVPVHSAYPAPLPLRINESIVDIRHAMVVEDVLDGSNFDIVHDHTLMGPWLAAKRDGVSVTTVHNPVSRDNLAYTERASRLSPVVGVSRSHVRSLPTVRWAGFVHNGIRTSALPFADRSAREDWVLFLGRNVRIKGVHVAIDAARAAGRRIVLAVKCNEPVEKRYFSEWIEPRLGPDVDWLGEVDFATKGELLARASCLLNPVEYNEPFGLVMAEAHACGTPVVALDRGACAEVVEHGVTGWICRTPAELPAALSVVEGLSSQACRDRAVSAFDESVMAAGYEQLYHRLVAAR
ncbi:MAG: glycosyltransferase [Pseudonocardiaceae bacterium]